MTSRVRLLLIALRLWGLPRTTFADIVEWHDVGGFRRFACRRLRGGLIRDLP